MNFFLQLFGNATKCYEFTLKLSVVEFQQTTCQEALTLLPSTEREMSAKGQIFFTCDGRPSENQIHAGNYCQCGET